MYNITCELREVQGRNKADALSGRLISTFKAKKFREATGSGFEGTGTASNSREVMIQFKYFGIDVVPQKHGIVMDGQGYMISSSQVVNPSYRSNKQIKGKTIIRLMLQ